MIDSEAFRDLSPSAVVVLLLLARNLDLGRNGDIRLAADYAEQRGIAPKTLYRSLVELQAHGLIYQTRRGGNGICARWALTWLPLTKDTRGLRVENFIACAWRDWTPPRKKNRQVKMSSSSGQIYRSAPELVDKFTSSHRTNLPTLKLIPIGSGVAVGVAATQRTRLNGTTWIPDLGDRSGWIDADLRRLAERGLAGQQCYQIPAEELPS